jgi:hypothetical protein
MPFISTDELPRRTACVKLLDATTSRGTKQKGDDPSTTAHRFSLTPVGPPQIVNPQSINRQSSIVNRSHRS